MKNLPEIIANYDALIVDLWGVIHDGTALYPGVADTLRVLHELNKPVVFLSNAPRVTAKARANLVALGIPDMQYQDIITSGQVARDVLAQAAPPPNGGRLGGGLPQTPQSDSAPHLTSPRKGEGYSAQPSTPRHTRNYYYLGPSKDEDVLADVLHIHRVRDAADADFILCTGYERDGQPHEEIIPVLQKLLPLPLLCINPDMEVVKQDGTQMLCAGAVAAAYTALGGKSAYIGKPFPEVYAAARAQLEEYERILCVGDNPATDIKGANDAGLDSLLITGGVLKVRYGADLTDTDAREICRIAGVIPTHVLAGFTLA